MIRRFCTFSKLLKRGRDDDSFILKNNFPSRRADIFFFSLLHGVYNIEFLSVKHPPAA